MLQGVVAFYKTAIAGWQWNWRFGLSLLINVSIILTLYFWDPPEFTRCRGYRPNKAELNGYPLRYDDSTCHDLPLIDAKVVDGLGRNARFSESCTEHTSGIFAKDGDTIRVRVWFHNSGAENKRSETTANGIRIGTIFDKNPTQVHEISAVVTAQNAETITSSDHGGSIRINTSTPSVFQYVADSTEVCLLPVDDIERGVQISVSCGNYPDGQIRYAAKVKEEKDGPANNSVGIGNLKAGDTYSGYLFFHLKVATSMDGK